MQSGDSGNTDLASGLYGTAPGRKRNQRVPAGERRSLLDTVENEELLQILLSTDKKTLQMIVLKMMGYAPKEISHHMELPEQTVYTRLRRLREKIKKSMKFE